MDLSSLRGLVLELNFSAHGVPATVTPPNGDAVETRIIWLTQTSPDFPGGLDIQRRDARRVLAVPNGVPAVSRGTLIQAPEHHQFRVGVPLDPAEILSWRVDGIESQDVDHTRVIVLPVEVQ